MGAEDLIERARQLDAAATPGPWRWTGNIDYEDPRIIGRERPTVARPQPGMREVLGHVPVERTAFDLEVTGYLEVTTFPDLSDDEAREFVAQRWCTEPWDQDTPRTDSRLAFVDDLHIYRPARDLAIFEVKPSAASRNDPGVYRANIIGLRHPDADFLVEARAIVPALLAEIDRLRLAAVEVGE